MPYRTESVRDLAIRSLPDELSSERIRFANDLETFWNQVQKCMELPGVPHELRSIGRTIARIENGGDWIGPEDPPFREVDVFVPFRFWVPTALLLSKGSSGDGALDPMVETDGLSRVGEAREGTCPRRICPRWTRRRRSVRFQIRKQKLEG